MSALKNLQDAVANLATARDAVVIVVKNRGVAEADVQAQADAVNAVTDSLNAALNPPPVI